MGAKEITEAEWDDTVINSAKPVVVDFWAEFCSPCRAMSRVLDEVANEHDEIAVVKINIEDYPEIAARYNVSSIPFFARFDAGKLTRSVVGSMSKPKLVASLLDSSVL